MLRDRRRNARRKIRLKELTEAIYDATDIESMRSARKDYSPDDEQAIKVARYLWRLKTGMANVESDFVLEKAERYAIEIPTEQEKPSWWERSDEYGESIRWLSPIGRTAVLKLVQEEKRRIIEWRVKVLAPILSALISLLGLVIALITVLKK